MHLTQYVVCSDSNVETRLNASLGGNMELWLENLWENWPGMTKASPIFFLIVDVIYRVTGWILNFQRAPSVWFLCQRPPSTASFPKCVPTQFMFPSSILGLCFLLDQGKCCAHGWNFVSISIADVWLWLSYSVLVSADRNSRRTADGYFPSPCSCTCKAASARKRKRSMLELTRAFRLLLALIEATCKLHVAATGIRI